MTGTLEVNVQQLEHAKARLDTLKLQPGNKQHILSFVEIISAEGLSLKRQLKYVYTLGKLDKMLNKNFATATKQDIVKVVSTINNSTEFKEWTKYSYKVIIKKFYKCLRDTEEYPPEVKWITLMKTSRSYKGYKKATS